METYSILAPGRQPMANERSHLQLSGIVVAIIALFITLLPIQAQTDPVTQRLTDSYLFRERLFWVGTNAPDPKDSQALWDAFGVGKGTSLDDAIPRLEAYMQANPQSPWTPALQAKLGSYYLDHGYFTPALERFKSAWEACNALTDSAGNNIANDVLGDWLQLLGSLGRAETVKVG